MKRLLDPQQGDERFGGGTKPRFRHAVDVAEQLEAVDDRKVPPQLRALAEDDADASDMTNALIPGNAPVDFAMSG